MGGTSFLGERPPRLEGKAGGGYAWADSGFLALPASSGGGEGAEGPRALRGIHFQ